MSAAPLTDRARAVLAALAGHLGGRIPIIGVGGIMAGKDAVDRIAAGATLIQLYTGLVYAGPGLIAECREAIAAAG